jgi:hypothetical protein
MVKSAAAKVLQLIIVDAVVGTVANIAWEGIEVLLKPSPNWSLLGTPPS